MKKLLKKKKELIIGVVLLLAVIICVVFIITNNNDKKENDNNDENTKIEDVIFTEEDLKNAYGVSKDDAINIVKPLFKSDNFEYTAVVTKSAKYQVTVKNTISKKEYKFEVDPVTKSYSEIEK